MTICALQYLRYISTDSVTVGATEVAAVSTTARNLGVVVDLASKFSMDHHIQKF